MKYIVDIRCDISARTAFDRCARIAAMGLVSGRGDRKQHCYVTSFKDGTSIVVDRRRSGTERFLIMREGK